MRCVGLVCILGLSCLFVGLHPAEVAAAEAKDKAKEKKPEQVVPDSAYVKVTLTKAGRKFVHPGFRIAEHEEGVFEIDSGEQVHELAVSINDVDAEVFRIHVDYLVDGSSKYSDDLVVYHGDKATFTKAGAELVIDLDPQGSQDKARKDEDKLDEPDDCDDPLGGM